MLLNRYVDLTEAIEEGNASLLDNSDFAEATNVPLVDDRTLPTKQVRMRIKNCLRLGENCAQEVKLECLRRFGIYKRKPLCYHCT